MHRYRIGNRQPKHSEICVCSNSLTLLQRHGRGGWRDTLICRFLNSVPQVFNFALIVHICSIRVS